MGIFKEQAIALEKLEQQQVQIYSDSCDAGIYATDKIKEMMRWILKTILPLPGSKVVWRTDKPYIQRQYNLRIYFSHEDWIDYEVHYINDTKHKKEFFSVTCKPNHIYIV